MGNLRYAIMESSFHLAESGHFSPRTKRNLERVGAALLWLGYFFEGTFKLRWQERKEEKIRGKISALEAELPRVRRRIEMLALEAELLQVKGRIAALPN